MSVNMHPGGSRPAGQQIVAEPRPSADSAGDPEVPVADKGPPGPAPSEASDGGESASAPTADDGMGATSVSEADGGVEESEGESGGKDLSRVVAADSSRVGTTVADGLGSADPGSADPESDDEDEGEEMDAEEMDGDEFVMGGCSPEEVPDELINDFNNGCIIIKA